MSDNTPLEFFILKVTDEMLERSCSKRIYMPNNSSAATILLLTPGCMIGKKATYDLSELKKLLALIVVMGFVNNPTLEDYWATYWPYGTLTFAKVRQGGIDLWAHLRTGAREHKLSFMIPKWREGLNVMCQQCTKPFHVKYPLLSHLIRAPSKPGITNKNSEVNQTTE